MTTQHTDALRPGAVVEARMSAAYKDGRATVRAREQRVNPWDGTSSSAVERVLSKMWARGYSAGNPMPLLAEPVAAEPTQDDGPAPHVGHRAVEP